MLDKVHYNENISVDFDNKTKTVKVFCFQTTQSVLIDYVNFDQYSDENLEKIGLISSDIDFLTSAVFEHSKGIESKEI